MKDQNIKFPFEFSNIQDHEKEEVAKLFIGQNDPHEYLRVGPKGYFVYKDFEKIADKIYNMELRSTDIFVASCPRSGTTLTQELVWLIAKNLDFNSAKSLVLPKRFPFLEYSTFYNEKCREIIMRKSVNKEAAQKLVTSMATPAIEILNAMTDPRFVKTHLPMSLLPPNILEIAKIVYVARDPRDVIVSCYHHFRLFKQVLGFSCEFKQFWNTFQKNLYYINPLFEHIKEAWAMRHHPNMLFLFYEELSKDMPATIRKVAEFLNKDLTDQEIDSLCDHLNINNFKNNNSVNGERAYESCWYTCF